VLLVPAGVVVGERSGGEAVREEGQLPGTWQELEAVVGRALAECGYDVEVQKNVKLARGDVDIDVWADDHSSPRT
jgi:hypothetical protein